jgi:hypothetical protein
MFTQGRGKLRPYKIPKLLLIPARARRGTACCKDSRDQDGKPVRDHIVSNIHAMQNRRRARFALRFEHEIEAT